MLLLKRLAIGRLRLAQPGRALATLVVNKMRGILNVCAVKAPGYGDRRKAMLGDIAALTGGTRHLQGPGHSAGFGEAHRLGRAKKLIITGDDTTIVGGGGKKEAIDGRADQIRREIEATDSDYDREKLQERLAKLAGGVAQINCGAATETEMKERKALLEDAKAATQAAFEEGIVPGGGVALIRSEKALDKLDLQGRRKARRRDRSQRARLSACGPSPTTPAQDGAVVVNRVRADEGQERRLRRRQGSVLRPGRGGHHRSGEGRPHRPAKRGQRGRAAADHRIARHRNPQGRGRRRRPRRITTTAWAAWAAWAAWEAWAAWVAWAAWE